jgi:hypothetical protein
VPALKLTIAFGADEYQVSLAPWLYTDEVRALIATDQPVVARGCRDVEWDCVKADEMQGGGRGGRDDVRREREGARVISDEFSLSSHYTEKIAGKTIKSVHHVYYGPLDIVFTDGTSMRLDASGSPSDLAGEFHLRRSVSVDPIFELST